ncbi:Lrp/AsnC family transcriptional regulator [Pseudoflavonifractor sp. 60]|uniref:Lrp/AsnC family transcriptional regulator n=1 Tax=Pseudoflavonifractor sp. 60 TaxID=2304576 RepID=UPI00136BE461|nr:Lrp/AsnC family transcriptional regulator [Pseudoflavonifractor sp. 60]NBI65833.1 Lrp/AsnC family transcriptional regulator [Pseudoflavonifractor sp. 60]
MDRTDYQILNILQRDSRTTLKCIGDQVGLTAPAVSERIRRMEEKGVIKGFSISVDRTLLDSSLTGFILIALFPEKYSQFCKYCENTPAITAHHHLVGKLNALLRFAVKDTHQLNELLSSLKQYGDSQTSVELETCFEYKDMPLPK